jgi:hypothetical protein
VNEGREREVEIEGLIMSSDAACVHRSRMQYARILSPDEKITLFTLTLPDAVVAPTLWQCTNRALHE